MIEIKYTASLKHGKFLKVDGDNSADITYTAPASELPEIIKHTLLSGKSFEVTIREANENQK